MFSSHMDSMYLIYPEQQFSPQRCFKIVCVCVFHSTLIARSECSKRLRFFLWRSTVSGFPKLFLRDKCTLFDFSAWQMAYYEVYSSLRIFHSGNRVRLQVPALACPCRPEDPSISGRLAAPGVRIQRFWPFHRAWPGNGRQLDEFGIIFRWWEPNLSQIIQFQWCSSRILFKPSLLIL